MVRPIAVALVVMALTWSASAWAVDDPRLNYHTITTPHFYVHYYDGLEALATRTAVVAEEAHQILTPLLAWMPADRTHVLVIDRLDSANGSANVFERNVITIFGMAPEADGTLGFYDDWLRVLVYHEYVHILHLDTTFGFIPYVNTILGKIWPPNRAVPRWYIEGLAVHMESTRTGGGRIRSSLYKMWMREAALAGDIDLGKVSHFPTVWPLGSSAYLYGGYFIHFVAKHYGENFFTDFHVLYGGRPIPLSMNQASRELIGTDFEAMWERFAGAITAEGVATRVAVRARGEVTALEHITRGGVENKFPRLRPKASGEVSFHYANFRDHPSFVSVDARGRRRELFDVDSAAGTSAWSPDGRYLVYSRGTVERSIYTYQDLFAYDMRSDSHRRLTAAERARDPAVSPDGKRLAYVRNSNGTMELVIRRLADSPARASKVLISGELYDPLDDRRWQQIATPSWSADGRKLAFSWWRLDTRHRDLWQIHFDDQGRAERLEQLTRDSAMDLDPYFGPEGLLYFSSDRSGIYNIYALDPERPEDVWQVSNVYAGLFSPRVSDDGAWIYATGYTHDGYDIVRFGKPKRFRRALPEAKRLIAERTYPKIDRSSWRTTRYSPWPWMRPLTLVPNLGFLSGTAGFGATLTGGDVLRRHSYTVSGGFLLDETLPGGLGFNIAGLYSYGRLPFDVTVRASYQTYGRQTGLFAADANQPFVERQVVGDLILRYPLRQIWESVSLRGALRIDHRGFADQPEVDPEPGNLEPRFPSHGWFNELSFDLIYSGLESFPYSVTVDRGFGANIGMTLEHPAIGSDFETLSLRWGARAFLPVPWFDRHVLALQLNGALIASRESPDLAYTIGGPPPQNIFNSLLFIDPIGGAFLRGYPRNAARGPQFELGSLEYRFPLIELDAGFSMVPLFFRRLKGRLFADAGAAHDGFLADAEILTSVGGELEMDLFLFYVLPGSLRLGYAYGFDERATNDVYVLYGGGF